MIKSAPAFVYTSHFSLTQWYGHVQLLPDRILGQWFCLDRRTGKLLWERRHYRPTTIVGISDGVIVADETRSDGPWTCGFGCYGLSLDTGEILWASHGKGPWGRIVRLFDFVPGFTNEFRDAPVCIVGEECVCDSGRVLRVRDGECVRRLPKDKVRRLGSQKTRSDAQNLYDGRYANLFTRVQIGEGKWLSHKRSSDDVCKTFNLHLLADDGSVLWSFNLDSTGYHMSHSNYYAYRYCPPHVYMIASEEPTLKPHPTKAYHVLPNPAICHVLTLDLVEGRIVQDQRISDRKFPECRIEDADERGLAISAGGKELMYYERTSS